MKVPYYFIVVDDDPMNNLICKHIIQKYNQGAEIQVFTDPKKALEMIEKFDDSSENPDIVLFLDINMPSMSGWEFLNEFENFAVKIQQQISIYMLSSSIDQTDKDKANVNSLVKGYISKPLSLDLMNQIFT